MRGGDTIEYMRSFGSDIRKDLNLLLTFPYFIPIDTNIFCYGLHNSHISMHYHLKEFQSW